MVALCEIAQDKPLLRECGVHNSEEQMEESLILARLFESVPADKESEMIKALAIIRHQHHLPLTRVL